jgi:hypothetical protein
VSANLHWKLLIKHREGGNKPMSDSVKKIFIVLIVVVACVMIGALVLNVLMPNVMVTIVDSVENMINRATGMSVDFNGNGVKGSDDGKTGNTVSINNAKNGNGKAVKGYQKGMQ